MARNYRYEKLMEFFRKQNANRITLTFNQIEEIIGFPLYPSAREHPQYWNTSLTHTITRSWEETGYKKDMVDLKSEIIVFIKAN